MLRCLPLRHQHQHHLRSSPLLVLLLVPLTIPTIHKLALRTILATASSQLPLMILIHTHLRPIIFMLRLASLLFPLLSSLRCTRLRGSSSKIRLVRHPNVVAEEITVTASNTTSPKKSLQLSVVVADLSMFISPFDLECTAHASICSHMSTFTTTSTIRPSSRTMICLWTTTNTLTLVTVAPTIITLPRRLHI